MNKPHRLKNPFKFLCKTSNHVSEVFSHFVIRVFSCCLHQTALKLVYRSKFKMFSLRTSPMMAALPNSNAGSSRCASSLKGRVYAVGLPIWMKINTRPCHTCRPYILEHLPWILIVHLHTLADGTSPQSPRWPDSSSGIQPLNPLVWMGEKCTYHWAREPCG